VEAVFWFSVAFIAYVYAGYPLVLGAWARLVGGRTRRSHGATERKVSRNSAVPPCPGGPAERELPRVSVIIAARDEARRLPARIDNILASDYPADRLEVIVASDGSTDDTAEALAPYKGRITLLLLPASGKAGALNEAVREATHPVLVFADARQRFAPDAIRRLASHFDDEEIGAVSGELMIEDDGSSTIGEGVGAYWTYEKWLRRRESIVGSTLGVTGAIYAMRRGLWRPLPADTILDDVMAPMRVVLRGYRVTFDDQARAFDEAAKDSATERRRKSRTLAGNFQLLAREPRLLVPLLNPVWLQFMSHKVARLFVPYALLAALLTSALLASSSWIYATALAGQLGFYGLAVYGALLEARARRAPVTASEVYREAA
jgi:cellulose synthase/poly-beta-1,6-N-acetylglucosamine synthase-like glycosyltransferase